MILKMSKIPPFLNPPVVLLYSLFQMIIFKLQFNEEPSYDKLKHILKKAILNLKRTPNLLFHWSEFTLSI
jgi:hypothetical protein